MSPIKSIEKFNTHSMSDETVLNVVTGRDLLIKNLSSIIEENIKRSETIQHVVLIGPRGMGKSFMLRYFQIITKKENFEGYIDFALLPEEQHNINTASEFIDELIARIDPTGTTSKSSPWNISHENWDNSVDRLKEKIEKKCINNKNYLFIAAVENLDILLESVFKSKVDESRLRKLLSGTPNFMLLATSLKFDIDTDYNKRLFYAYQKFHIEQWKEEDYMSYFYKRFELLKIQNPDEYNQKDIGLLTNKLKAISRFTGGSPRMAVVLTNLIFNDDAVSTAQNLNDIVEDLSPYYQDLMFKMPNKSKILFDTLIREKENISQSELSKKVGTEQATISQAFKWLVDNNYIIGHRISGEKKYRYSVSDRVFVLFYYKRYVHNGLQCSYIRILSDFLISFYDTKELSENSLKYLHRSNKPEGIEFAKLVFQKTGLNDRNINWENFNEVESEIKKIIFKEEIDHLFSTAENKLKEQNFEEALLLHQEALEKSILEEDLSQRITCLERIGKDFYKLKNYNKAIEYHKKAYELSKEKGNLSDQAWNLGRIGWNYNEIKSFEKSIECHQQAYELRKEEANILGQAWNLGRIGWNYKELESFEKSIEYNLQAYELYKEKGNISGQAFNLGQIGWNFTEIKDFKKAIEYHQQAYKLSKEEGDISRQAFNLGQLGWNFAEIKDFKKAIEYHQQAYELSKEEGDKFGQSFNLDKLGRNLTEVKEYRKAIEYLKKASKLHKKAGDINGLARNLGLIGVNYRKLHDYKKAIQCHKKSYDLFKQDDDVLLQALNLNQTGLNYKELKDFQKAIKYHNQAYELVKEEGNILGQITNLGNLGWIYKEIKEFEKAIEYHQQGYELGKEEGNILVQAWNLGQIGVNYLLDNSDKAWSLFEDERFSGIPKEKIFKEYGDAVIYTEKWNGKAAAFKIANEILSALKTNNWNINKHKAFSDFFANLLNMKLSFDLLRDICIEAKGMFDNEGDVIIEAVEQCIGYIESGKDDNYLLKLNPDMASVVKEIVLEATL